jgi:hypothetical protein
MTLHLELTPDLEAKLRRRAEVEGKEPTEIALEAVRQKLSEPDQKLDAATIAKRLEAWKGFVARMSEHSRKLPRDHILDDSRESIY